MTYALCILTFLFILTYDKSLFPCLVTEAPRISSRKEYPARNKVTYPNQTPFTMTTLTTQSGKFRMELYRNIILFSTYRNKICKE